MGSAIGAMKVAAVRAGLPLEEYQSRLNEGFKYCWACKEWHVHSDFQADLSRGDGLAAICKIAKSLLPRKNEQNSEVIRANRLIQMRVHRGTLPNPNTLLCLDCGHIGDDRRHEYDHYRGYAGDAKSDVQPVCTLCHARRHKERRSGR